MSYILALFSLVFLGLVFRVSGGDCPANSKCGGNCPGGCQSCPCGTTRNPVSISNWCQQYSGWSQGCCECIARHESDGNANAMNQNTDGSYDVGLWQINSVNWPSCSGGSPPCDTTTNLQCAKSIFQYGGNTWKMWTTCSACGCCYKP